MKPATKPAPANNTATAISLTELAALLEGVGVSLEDVALADAVDEPETEPLELGTETLDDGVGGAVEEADLTVTGGVEIDEAV